jgi:hypothetical protein
VILSIFLNLKSHKYFLRKMGSKKRGIYHCTFILYCEMYTGPRWQKGRGAYYRDRYLARLALLDLPPCFHFLPSLHRAHVATCNLLSSPKTVAKERVKSKIIWIIFITCSALPSLRSGSTSWVPQWWRSQYLYLTLGRVQVQGYCCILILYLDCWIIPFASVARSWGGLSAI